MNILVNTKFDKIFKVFSESLKSKELIEFIKSKRSYTKNKVIRRLYNKEV